MSEPATLDRRDARVLVSEGAVLTVTRAAELLGFGGAEEWLRDEGLVSSFGFGRRRIDRVVWRSVLERLEACSEVKAKEPEPTPKKRRRKAHRLAVVD